MKTNKLIAIISFFLFGVVGANATITTERLELKTDVFLLLKFSKESKSDYRLLEEVLVESGMEDLIGGCSKEKVIADRFGRTVTKEFCKLSFYYPSTHSPFSTTRIFPDRLAKAQVINLDYLIEFSLYSMYVKETDKSKERRLPQAIREKIGLRTGNFLKLLGEKVGRENPISMAEIEIDSEFTSGASLNGGGGGSTSYFFDKASYRAAYMTSSRRIVCAGACFLRVLETQNFTENEIIRNYPKGAQLVALKEIECSEKISGRLHDHQGFSFYSDPFYVFTHPFNYSGVSFDDYNVKFSNVKFSQAVRDQGHLCELTNVSDLPDRHARSSARFINIITCKLNLEERPSLYTVATYDVQSCNHPDAEF